MSCLEFGTKIQTQKSIKNVLLVSLIPRSHNQRHPRLYVGGFPIAVSNGRDEIKKSAFYTTQKSGGNGAIREISDLIINAKDKE